MKVNFNYNFWSLAPKATITNEAGETIMTMKGRLISPTRKQKLYDKDGNLLYIIRNKFWFNWFVHKTFIYDANKNKIATLKDRYLSLKNTYIVTGYKDEITIDGHLASLHSNIIVNNEPKGSIDRKIDVRGNLILEAGEENIPFFSALVIAISAMNGRKEKSSK